MHSCVMSVPGRKGYAKYGLEIRKMRCRARLNPEARDDLRKNSLRKLTYSQFYERYSQGCGKRYK